MINKNNNDEILEESCVHKSCPDCKGSGTKSDGNMCVHYISCSCSKCNPVKQEKKLLDVCINYEEEKLVKDLFIRLREKLDINADEAY